LEGFLVFQVLIPLSDGRFVLSAHASPLFKLLPDGQGDIRGGCLPK
jgi:hypothetical protein